jgi:undecaprenyl-phosphate galactose phosphotransferase
MHAAQTVSRLFFVLFAVFVLFYIYAVRYILLHYLKDNHDFYEPVLLIGAGKTAERVLRFFDGDLGYRYQVIGVLDDGPGLESVTKRCRHLGGLHRAERIAKHTHVGTVLITAPGLEKEKLQALITGMQPYVRNIAFVPDLIGTPMADVQVNVLFSEKIMMLGLRNNLARQSNRIMKRIFDLTATILGGAVISPFLLLLVLIVFIDNKGRVIFAHRRVGQHGKEFNCYKFQSMVSDAQKRLEEYLAANPEAKKEWEENFKLEHDPRVTKLGAFLRRTSLDELPQLWNVIMGDMSLVGPRPVVQAEVPKYGP